MAILVLFPWYKKKSIDVLNVIFDPWHMTCDTWHVTHDVWHVTHDMWHMTCDTWHVTHDMWHMTCDTWHVTHDIWHMICDTWYVTHDMWHMTFDMWHMTFDTWHVTHDMWQMTHDKWREVALLLKFQLPSFNCLVVMVLGSFFYKNVSLTELSTKVFSEQPSATQGLLKWLWKTKLDCPLGSRPT